MLIFLVPLIKDGKWNINIKIFFVKVHRTKEMYTFFND